MTTTTYDRDKLSLTSTKQPWYYNDDPDDSGQGGGIICILLLLIQMTSITEKQERI